jgi:hypothetical protein
MRGRLLAVALVGCGFSPHDSATGADGGNGEGMQTDAPCPSATEQFDTCMFGSGSDLTISQNAIYNTDSGALTSTGGNAIPHQHAQLLANGVMIDVLVVGKFQLSATLIVEGSLPLAIYASSDVTIGGELSIDPGDAGARTTCTGGAMLGTDDKEGGGGGGGGGFQGSGGSGGTGSNGVVPGGAGGLAMVLPTMLVGGCAGANGGSGDNSVLGGLGGFGGGVVLIATDGMIEITGGGGIDANGEGGQVGGSNKTGGGGGGAGGLIVLEAGVISNDGYVVTNGGGGAEGENSDGGADGGRPGSNGTLTTMLAAGGTGGTEQGGDGGSGGAGSTLGGSACTDVENDGGGGGGGGVGFIGVTQTPSGAGVFSPLPTTWAGIH